MNSPASIELVRPWRTATLVAGGLAAVELVLLIVCGLIIAGRSVAPREAAAAAPAAAHEPAARTHAAKRKAKPKATYRPPRKVATLPRKRTGVVVLNGNGVTGAAAQAASLARSRGYPIKQVGNAPRTGFPTWRVMYAPRRATEAKRFARDLGIPVRDIGPLDGMTPAQLHGGKLVLILGASR